MAQIKHQNNGKCQKCAEIFDKYSNFNKQLRGWFILFQAKHPEAHISCAGRGFEDQEAAVTAGASRAHFGQSAHNFNCAIDVFVILPKTDLYDKTWFNKILAPEIPYFLKWYGEPGCSFPELPHIEMREWRGLHVQGLAHLVEQPPGKEEVS